MRMQYSRRRNGGLSGGVIGIAVVGLVVLIIVVLRLFAPNIFFALAQPALQSGSSATASVGGLFAGLQNAAKLQQDNARLADEVAELKNENLALTTRDQDLTQLLGDSNAESGILAGVIARPPESAYDTLLVGSGKNGGIVTGAEVFGQDGIPIGTVSQVNDHTAIVTLFSSPSRSTSGWVGSERTPLTLVGAGAGAFTASLPKGATVTAGDNVYVPGPGALPIGTVLKVQSDPSSPTLVIDVQPVTNIFSLTWVEIARVAH